jgi:hypothetical protein
VGRGREAAEAARAYAAPWWPVGQAIAVGMTLRWVRLAFALVGSERAERAARTRKIRADPVGRPSLTPTWPVLAAARKPAGQWVPKPNLARLGRVGPGRARPNGALVARHTPERLALELACKTVCRRSPRPHLTRLGRVGPGQARSNEACAARHTPERIVLELCCKTVRRRPPRPNWTRLGRLGPDRARQNGAAKAQAASAHACPREQD